MRAAAYEGSAAAQVLSEYVQAHGPLYCCIGLVHSDIVMLYSMHCHVLLQAIGMLP